MEKPVMLGHLKAKRRTDNVGHLAVMQIKSPLLWPVSNPVLHVLFSSLAASFTSRSRCPTGSPVPRSFKQAM
jgi:hypothetical protein